MAESFDFNKPDDDELDPSAPRGYAEEAPETEEDDQPRRAASARFIVDSQVGSEAMLRDAMDPANQSLAEALRLSFRVLQAVIIVLIVLFLASGFKTVDDGFSGVRTVWGKIVATLTPGPQFSFYPYPAGEFVTFKAENRTVTLGEYFSMASHGRPREAIIEQTEVSTPVNPGRDGSLITRDGDLAHIEVSAKYEIDQPLDFVHNVNDADTKRDADEIVRMALRRAAVHVVGAMSVTELSEPGRVPELKVKLREQAQTVLDEVKSGIRIVDITDATGTAPIAIQKAMNAVQEAQVAAGEAIENSRKRADQALLNMAGADYPQIIQLIDSYERALDAGDQQQSDKLLASIRDKLDSDAVTGEVSQIVNRARSYRSQIDSTLGNEYQRFAGYLPAFRAHPQSVIKQLWLEAYSAVISQPDTEIVYVPQFLASMNLTLSGSNEVQDLRNDLRRKAKQAAFNAANNTGPYVATGDEMSIDKAGRQLKATGSGLKPLGSGN